MTRHFAEAIDEILCGSPDSARALAKKLGTDKYFISSPTLSQWRRGKATPPPSEDTLFRLLALERRAQAPPGRAVAALYRAVVEGGHGTWRRSRRPAVPAGGPAALRAELERRGATNRCRSILASITEDYRIGPERKPLHCTSRHRLCAVTPRVRSRWVTFTVDHRSPAELEPVAGCEIGRQEVLSSDARYQVCAVELRHPELDVGDCHDLEFVVVNPPHPEIGRTPMPGWIRMVEDPGCRSLDLAVGFAPTQRPKEVWRGRWAMGPNPMPKPVDEEIATSEDGRFTLTVSNPCLGGWGFRWKWFGAMDAVPFGGSGEGSAR